MKIVLVFFFFFNIFLALKMFKKLFVGEDRKYFGEVERFLFIL